MPRQVLRAGAAQLRYPRRQATRARLYVTSFLADLFKTDSRRRLDLAKAERLKPPQLLPQSGGLPEGESRREVQSAIRALRED